MDAGQRPHAWDPPAGPDDHAPVDLLSKDRVRAADVAGTFGCDGGGLDAEPRFPEGLRSVMDHLVSGLPAPFE